MGLFTIDPIALSNGTTDQTFVFRAQLPDAKSIVGEYVEPAAADAVASKIVVKHDESSPSVRRRLFSRRFMQLLADGVTYKPVTINYSISYDKEHDESLLLANGHNVTVAALGSTDFFSNLTDGLI